MELIATGIAGTMESGDIIIEIEGRSGGGIEIDLKSTVLSQFGRQIRAVIEEAVAQCGIENAFVRAVDKGALDCTVRARVLTAAYRGAGRDDYAFI